MDLTATADSMRSMATKQPLAIGNVRMWISGADTLTIEHRGKTGQVVQVVIPADKLRRWALRELRERAFQ